MRLAVGATFFRSGMNKFESFDTAITLFREEYRLPLLPPSSRLNGHGRRARRARAAGAGPVRRLGAAALLAMTLVIQFLVYPANWPEHLMWASILAYVLSRGPGALSIDASSPSTCSDVLRLGARHGPAAHRHCRRGLWRLRQRPRPAGTAQLAAGGLLRRGAAGDRSRAGGRFHGHHRQRQRRRFAARGHHCAERLGRNSNIIIISSGLAAITLASDLPAVQKNVVIQANDNTLNGNNRFRGLFIGAWAPGTATQVPVAVTIQDLAITKAWALGGRVARTWAMALSAVAAARDWAGPVHRQRGERDGQQCQPCRQLRGGWHGQRRLRRRRRRRRRWHGR